MGSITTTKLKVLKEQPEDSFVVIIERFFPWWISSIKYFYDAFLPGLAPSKELLKELKDSIKKHGFKTAVGMTRFESRYRGQILGNSKSLNLLRKLKKIAKSTNLVLVSKDPIGSIVLSTITELMTKYQLGE